jgi:predicted RNA-binding protein YlqC (UPF0109 family)
MNQNNDPAMTTDTLAAPVRDIKPPLHITPPEIIALLRDVVMAYTRHHNDLKIEGANMGGSVALGIQSHLDDYGRLVGYAGGNIWALNVIFSRIGELLRQPVVVRLHESKVGTETQLQPFQPDQNFKHAPTTALLVRVLAMSLRFSCRLKVADVIHETHYEIDAPDDEKTIIWQSTEPQFVATQFVFTDYIRAIRNIFRAIGKNRGRVIRVHQAGTTYEDEHRDEQHAQALRMSPAISPRIDRTKEVASLRNPKRPVSTK